MNNINQKNQNCDSIMDTYLCLDKGDRIPFKSTLHFLTCKKCRSQVKMLKTAEKIAKAPLEIPVPIDDISILKVMQKIDPNYQSSKNPISISKWIIGGIAMILFMLTFRLSDYCKASEVITISFYLFFAFAVTVYCSVFVGSNMDFFVKMIKTKSSKISF